MKINTTLAIVSAILMAFIISACTPVDRIITKEKPGALSFINDKNQFVVVDVKTGKIVPPCSKRPTNGFKACRSPFAEKYKKAAIAVPKKQADKILASSGKVVILGHILIEIIDWKGSTCRTYIDRYSGDEFEVCW